MEKDNLTPEQSLLLISKTIEDTKERFKENGHIFIFWGTLTLLVFACQLTLSLLGHDNIAWYPVLLFPLVGGTYMLYTWVKEKKKNKPKTIIGNILGNLGLIFGMNCMIMGFFFSNQLGDALVPVFLILFALFIMACGLTIKFRALTIGGILLNLIGLGSFLLESKYQGFSMMIGAVVGLIVPGILLNIARRKENV